MQAKERFPSMNLVLHASICGAIVLAILGLFLYRKRLEDYCDHFIHLGDDTHATGIIDAQAAECKRIATIDKVAKSLIVAVCVYAAVVICIVTYNAWNAA